MTRPEGGDRVDPEGGWTLWKDEEGASGAEDALNLALTGVALRAGGPYGRMRKVFREPRMSLI